MRSLEDRRADRWLVLLVPLGALALAPHLLFSGPNRDAWIYYGYYENLVFYLRRFPDLYYTSRLAVVLPGFVVHHLFRPVVANLVLHGALILVAVQSFHAVARDLFGCRAAFLATMAAATHPFLLYALGWNYVDGFGIAYYLLGSALAARASRDGRGSWAALAGAGAACTALVSTNFFYGLYVPLIGGHFLLLDRVRERRSWPLSLAVAGAGAVGLYTALGTFSWLAGGYFHYLRSSFTFVADFALASENPFRDAGYAWLPKGVWLAVPLLTLLGGAIVLRRSRALLRQQWRLWWVHVQLVYVAAVLAYMQLFGDGAVLQHQYYASLLIPVAFLALAGQVAWLLPEEREWRHEALVALLLAAILVLPYALPLLPAWPEIVPVPLLWTLVAGAGIPLALSLHESGRRPLPGLLLFFGALALSHVVMSQSAGPFRTFERHGGDGRALFRQMSETVRQLERLDSRQTLRLWYDREAVHGRVYDAVASAFLLCPRMVNMDFPQLPTRRMCDGDFLRPGTRVAVLSDRWDVFELSADALRGVGLDVRLVTTRPIAGPIGGYAITELLVEELADGAEDEVAVGHDEQVGEEMAFDGAEP